MHEVKVISWSEVTQRFLVVVLKANAVSALYE